MKDSNFKIFILYLILSLGLIGISKRASGQIFTTIVAPRSQAGVEGNSVGYYPLDGFLGSMRYQQVYDAAEFSSIRNGGGLISGIGFRLDGGCRQGFGGGVTDASLQI